MLSQDSMTCTQSKTVFSIDRGRGVMDIVVDRYAFGCDLQNTQAYLPLGAHSHDFATALGQNVQAVGYELQANLEHLVGVS
jgi:hypothetical protein